VLQKILKKHTPGKFSIFLPFCAPKFMRLAQNASLAMPLTGKGDSYNKKKVMKSQFGAT